MGLSHAVVLTCAPRPRIATNPHSPAPACPSGSRNSANRPAPATLREASFSVYDAVPL